MWWYGKAGGRVCLSACRIAENAQRLTACGVRVLAVALAVRVRVGSFCPSVNVIFLSLIISAYSRGVFYSTNGNEKRRTVCVGSITLPQPLSRTPNSNPRMIVSETFPIVGGEFRNVNQWDFLVSVKIIDKFSRTVGNFIEDLSIS